MAIIKWVTNITSNEFKKTAYTWQQYERTWLTVNAMVDLAAKKKNLYLFNHMKCNQ